MTLFVIFRNQEKYTFYGLREHSIEYGKYLKFTYTGEKDNYWSEKQKKTHEGCFMLDAISGYYIHK